MKKTSLPHGVGRVSHPGPQAKIVQSGQPIVAPAMNIRISLSQLTTLRWSLRDEVQQLKNLAFDAIGLWRPKVAEVGEDLAADLLRDSGLGVASLSFVGGFTGDHGFSYDDAIADARDAICDAELLGAENLIVVSGSRNGHTIGHSRRCLVDALKELADDAAQRGVRLCLLPMHRSFSANWTYLNNIDETLEVLSRVNHAAVRMVFDTYQMWQESCLTDRIAEIARWTGIVQISDAKRAPQAGAERCLPGEGNIPLGEIVRGFQRAGFDGYYDVQVWSNSAWSGDYAVAALQSRQAVLRLAGQPVALIR